MTYRDACNHIGREPGEHRCNPVTIWDRLKHNRPSVWTPKETVSPSDLWQQKAREFVRDAQRFLWSNSGRGARKWLATERGFTEATIKRFRLGLNPRDVFLDRGTWGLPQELKDNGQPKRLWLPAGLVIPHLDAVGRIQRVKVRRSAQDNLPRYVAVPGSSMAPILYGEDRAVVAVLESELDAILVCQEAGDLAGAVALGSAQNRPDRAVTDRLNRAKLILVALDADEAGVTGCAWWQKHFDNVGRLPPVGGKDPGEMHRAGVNIRSWVQAGMQRYGVPVMADDTGERRPQKAVETPPEQAQNRPETPIPAKADVSPVVAPHMTKSDEIGHLWDSETDALIDRFIMADLPTEPFRLRQDVWIEAPMPYYRGLLDAIEAGPSGPRAKALRQDLADLVRLYGADRLAHGSPGDPRSGNH